MRHPTDHSAACQPRSEQTITAITHACPAAAWVAARRSQARHQSEVSLGPQSGRSVQVTPSSAACPREASAKNPTPIASAGTREVAVAPGRPLPGVRLLSVDTRKGGQRLRLRGGSVLGHVELCRRVGEAAVGRRVGWDTVHRLSPTRSPRRVPEQQELLREAEAARGARCCGKSCELGPLVFDQGRRQLRPDRRRDHTGKRGSTAEARCTASRNGTS